MTREGEGATHRLGHDGGIQLEHDLSSRFSTDADVEEDPRVGGRRLGERRKGFGGHFEGGFEGGRERWWSVKEELELNFQEPSWSCDLFCIFFFSVRPGSR